jgi:hypothetical protein
MYDKISLGFEISLKKKNNKHVYEGEAVDYLDNLTSI